MSNIVNPSGGGTGGGIAQAFAGNTSGTMATISSGTAVLAGGNNITLSQNGQNVTISAASQSVQTQNLVDVSLAGNTSGALALVSSGTLILAGGNNITLSQNAQSVTVSAASQSVQTQSTYAGTNLQMWALPPRLLGSTIRDQLAAGVMQIWPMPLDGFLSVTQANNPVSISLSTSSNSSYSINISLGLAVYTKNGSTISLASSGSQSYAFTITSNSSSASYSGVRALTLPFSANFTPGDYWFAASSSTASTNANWATVSQYVNSLANMIAPGYLGSATNASNQWVPGWGQWSVTSASFPASIAFGGLIASNASHMEIPMFALVNYTA